MKFSAAVSAVFVAALLEPATSLRRRLVTTHENNAAKKELDKEAHHSVESTHRMLQESDAMATAFYENAGNPMPVQTFFIPLPETHMFGHLFYIINHQVARPPIESLISVAISTDLTTVWYDHWEDGYDDNVVVGRASTTEVWGDGDASNGCAPGVLPCTNSNDRLMAGDTIVIQNTVGLPRNPAQVLYDGSDRIQASFPIAVTRGAYPHQPGSLMAGAVEVLDTDTWGTTFEAPIGMDVGQHIPAFQLTLFFIMAMEDKTRVTLQNGYVLTLNRGEGKAFRVNIGHGIQSNKPIQVTLTTGDVGSYFELRWYSLLPLEQFSTSYVSPVGDTFGKTKSLIYNPGPENAFIAVSYLDPNTKQQRNVGTQILPKQAIFSPVSPTGSGMWINATVPILCLSLTDSENYAGYGNELGTGGQFFDWGFPVSPRPDLTSQVLIGWGYGCTNNNCYGHKDRSVVWVSPIHDADIYVDFTNKGADYKMISLKALESHKFSDDGDHDMSGAIIFARAPGTGLLGPTVPIAAAWGQDPSVAYEKQSLSLDLGTTVPPMREVHASKLVSHVKATPGTILTYTIRISNLGQRVMQPNMVNILDKLGDYMTYVEGSTFYYSKSTGVAETTIPDDVTGSKFPLDEDGFVIPVILPRRGGVVDITFQVRLADLDNITLLPVQNVGTMQLPTGNRVQFKARTAIIFDPSVKIENTAYIGSDIGKSCESKGEEVAVGIPGNSVVYCFKVTNTGQSYLKDIFIVNEELKYQSSISGIMAPGESRTISTGAYMEGPLQNFANVTAIAVLKDGMVIEDEDPVKDRDPSAVELRQYVPKVSIENTVYKGHDSGSKCGTDESFEKVEDIYETPVTHCFQVTNTGETHLKTFVFQNGALSWTKTLKKTLAPGDSMLASFEGKIASSIVNTATVSATPILEDGSSPGLEDVSDSDTAEVVKLVFEASVEVKNTVYEGHDDGAKCGSDDATEFVGDFAGTDVTYCFEIVNTGETNLDTIKLSNADIGSFDTSSIPATLTPNEKHMVWVSKEISKTQINFATVTANPIFQDGRDLVDLADVTDTDPSEVAALAAEPAIEVFATVYRGHNSGVSCGTSKAVGSVEDFAGTDVTYCFTLHNVGNTYLSQVVFENTDLEFSSTVTDNMSPGGSYTIPFPSTIANTLLSELVVKVTPVNEAGEEIDGVGVVSGSDTSGVVEMMYNPDIAVENTVYVGSDDAGVKCATDGVEFVEADIGTMSTFCFLITNTGNTHLKNIRVKNTALSVDSTVDPLAPGESFTYSVVRPIFDRQQNHVTVSAEPSTKAGDDLPYKDVSDSDPSEVAFVTMTPGLKVVYVGSDDGAQCDTDIAVSAVSDIFYTDVQYCFTVENTGETFLTSIGLVNDEFDYTEELSSPLPPGKSITLSVPGKITSSLQNTVLVTGTPSWQPSPGGYRSIPGLSEVSVNDSSEVEKLEFEVGVQLKNTVKLGAHKKKCTGTEFVEDAPGSDVTYCFEVKNTGTSYLKEIEVASKDLLFFYPMPDLLAPGSSAFVSFPTIILGSEESYANVTAAPYTADGRLILDEEKVKDSDPATVNMVTPNPRVSITNKVYLGDDDGASCGTSVAVDEVEETFGTDVTYCFTVENTGDTAIASVQIKDEYLKFTDTSIASLAIGESATVSFAGTILETKTNEAVATADPVLDNGVDIGLGQVTDVDTSRVKEIAYEPSIYIQTTVYAGDEGATKCGGDEDSELAEGYGGYDVTYCFTVFNTGDSYLGSVKVTSDDLGFSEAIDGNVPPKESKVLTFKTSIESSTNITASANGNPTLEDGTDIPSAATVTATDPAGHRELQYSPSVQIDNLVAIGNGGGDACNDARNFVEGPYGEDVTYCFTVTNTGDSYLDTITINDDDLKFSQTLTGALEPGESIVVPYPAKIRGDLVNIATVIANPVTKLGEDISDQENLEASDNSSVGQFDYVGGVSIENTVYLGEDAGKCGSDELAELVEGISGTSVTYCFVVKNTGDTYLGDIVVSNDALGGFVDNSISGLAPGESALVSTSGDITEDLENNASVTANPVNKAGESIPDLEDVTNSDTSAVKKLQFEPLISIENLVYLGSDDGAQCGTSAAVESISGKLGELATFCFTVTNDGDSYLDSVSVVNAALDFTSDSVGMLAPGATGTIVFTGPISGAGSNDAVATGKPTLRDGTAIPELADVTDTDASEVLLLPFEPSISIKNTVYLGANGGSPCSSDLVSEFVESKRGDMVTYCFVVENTGDSYLTNLVLGNDDLSFSNDDIETLAPGATATVSFSTPIAGYLKNIATITGTPALPDGTVVPDLTEVSDSDPSAVGETFGWVLDPDLDTDKDSDFPVEDSGDGENEFTGEGIPGSDPFAPDDGGIPDPFEPMTPDDGGIPDPFTPTIPDDGGIPDPFEPMTPDDGGIPDPVSPAVPTAPSDADPVIKIQNTVYLGDDLGNSCPGTELASESSGSAVVYCFDVTNTGNTFIHNIVIRNSELNDYYDNSIGTLAPGASQLVTIQGAIAADLLNTAVVTGQPGMESAPFSDVDAVTDSDTSEVKLVLSGDVRFADKTPFVPPSTDPEGCIQDAFVPDEMLFCNTQKVYLDSVTADTEDSCLADGTATITVSLEATLQVTESVNDLGWYIATDGGDAMTGTCIVNGLQEGNTYDFEAGSAVWTAGGGDGDECGDVMVDGAGTSVVTPIAVNLTVKCVDDTDDGALDFALCFTWSSDSDGGCTISSNAPSEATGACYCTRYEVPNISVLPADPKDDGGSAVC